MRIKLVFVPGIPLYKRFKLVLLQVCHNTEGLGKLYSSIGTVKETWFNPAPGISLYWVSSV